MQLDALTRWEEIVSSARPRQIRVALLASFTVDSLVPYLGTALADAALTPEVWVGPYDQIIQECLAEESATAQYRPDVVVCWARAEELWRDLPLPLSDPPGPYVDRFLNLAETCLSAARRWTATLVLVLPAIPEVRPLGVGDAGNVSGVFATATCAREALRKRLAVEPSVCLLDAEETVRSLGSSQAYDARLDVLAHIPFSDACFSLLGERMARLIALGSKASKKVIIVDGDHTLWGGAVAEEGPDQVTLDAAFREFQRFLVEQRRSGMLLALCTKNDEDEVWAVFQRREMCLRRADLSAYRIGWNSKAGSLRELAGELGLGTESFIFIDDNPAEIAEVQSALPEVACLLMPADPADWRQLAESPVFDRRPPTAEDRLRPGFYREESQRRSLLARTPEEYRRQLGIEVSFTSPKAGDLPRLSQLVAKTNQLNLNGRRRSEAELAALCDDGNFIVRLVSVRDRFGEYGMVGAFLLERAGAHWLLDTFLLSCRVLGRGVEESMLACAFELAGGTGITAVLETLPRNQPARQFFVKLGCSPGVPSTLPRVAWPEYITGDAV